MLKGIQHRIQTFSLLGAATCYSKMRNNPSVFFVYSPRFKLSMWCKGSSLLEPTAPFQVLFHHFALCWTLASPFRSHLALLLCLGPCSSSAYKVSPFITISQHLTHLSISNSHTTFPHSVAWHTNWKKPLLSLCLPNISSISLFQNLLFLLQYNYLTKYMMQLPS